MSQVKFTEGERVLCYHGQLIYEAKLLKTQVKDRTVKYYIHYAGWSKNWDEWVSENRVLKYNEENVQKQKEIQKKVENSSKNAKKTPKMTTKKSESNLDDASTSRSSTPSKDVAPKESTPKGPSRGSSQKPTAAAGSTTTSKDPSSASSNNNNNRVSDDDVIKKKRQRLDTSVSNEGEERINRTEINITIPKELKTYLVDDWHAINAQHKLVEIPAKITVEDIVEKYKQRKSKSGGGGGGGVVGKGQSCEDISNGILEYFNVMLGSQLLYKVERTQYADILQKFPDKPMSQIYGAFHLLRLFVKLGTVLSFTTLDKNNIRVLIDHLKDFLDFLKLEQKEYFNTICFSHHQTSEYLRRANP